MSRFGCARRHRKSWEKRTSLAVGGELNPFVVLRVLLLPNCERGTIVSGYRRRRRGFGQNSPAADAENGLKLCLLHGAAGAFLQAKGRAGRATEVNWRAARAIEDRAAIVSVVCVVVERKTRRVVIRRAFGESFSNDEEPGGSCWKVTRPMPDRRNENPRPAALLRRGLRSRLS